MSVGPPVLRHILCDNCSFSGGTKTSVVLLSPCGEVLSEVEGPASNLFVCAPSSFYEKLKKIMENCKSKRIVYLCFIYFM